MDPVFLPIQNQTLQTRIRTYTSTRGKSPIRTKGPRSETLLNVSYDTLQRDLCCGAEAGRSRTF